MANLEMINTLKEIKHNLEAKKEAEDKAEFLIVDLDGFDSIKKANADVLNAILEMVNSIKHKKHAKPDTGQNGLHVTEVNQAPEVSTDDRMGRARTKVGGSRHGVPLETVHPIIQNGHVDDKKEAA